MKKSLTMILGCLALAFLAVSPAIGIGLLWVRETGGDTASVPWLQLWLVASGSLFLLLLPVCIAGRATLRRLQFYVDAADERLGTSAPVGPFWLRPVLRTFVSTIERFRDRERELQMACRDLEIRNHVATSARKQVEAVLEVMSDVVLVTNTFDEIVLANAAAGRLFGFDHANVTDRPLSDLIQDETVLKSIASTRSEGNLDDCRRLELTVTGVQHEGEGEGPCCDLTLSCVGDHRGDVSAVVTIIRDRTREQELSRMKSEFVSKASHELRTPLSSVRAYVEMLVDGEAEDDATRHDFYRIIQGETERLTRLVDNMLNISRIEAGIVHIDRDLVDVGGLIEQAMETLEPQAREKDITVLKTLAPVTLGVQGDRDMLYQVILNLLSNAVKYTPQGGRVTLSADSDNLTRSVHVSVSDTGLGVPPQDRERIFETFYRIENYKRVAEGTGLGLHLCRHIVETVHQGQIGLDSKLGMGSRFWFSVPMGEEAAMRAA